MNGVNIISMGYALPEKVVTNDDLSKIMDTNDEWISSRTGIKQRRYCVEETCTTLAVEAATKALNKAEKEYGLDKNEIGTVVVATTTAEDAFPNTACQVQKALGLSKEVMSFDMGAACSGFVYGLNVCRGLLLAGQKKYALLIGSEHLSRIMDFTDRGSCILFGDGAAAAIIELSDKPFYHRAWSDGDTVDTALSCKGICYNDAKTKMNGTAVFKFAVRVLKQSVDAVLKDAGLTVDDVDYVVCHQANERIIDTVKKKYPGNEDKFFVNITNYANTSAASIPLALCEMQEKGMLKEGMKIVVTGFGAGFTWSSALITI